MSCFSAASEHITPAVSILDDLTLSMATIDYDILSYEGNYNSK